MTRCMGTARWPGKSKVGARREGKAATDLSVAAAIVAAVLVLGQACAAGHSADEEVATVSGGAVCGGSTKLSRAAEVSPATLDAHLRFLADDSLEGRGTGTRGYDLAARYVAACFTKFGLKPSGTRAYLQPVSFRRARALEESSLVLDGSRGRRELVHERDYIPVPDYLRSSTQVAAPVVLVGFGITHPARGYDDYQAVDARGKIVVVLTGGPASFPPTERAHYSSAREKNENAVRHGAVGALVVRTQDQTFPWDRLVRQARAGGMRWLDSSGKPRDVYPELQGIAVLSDSGAEMLFEGAPRSLAEVLAAAKAGTPPAFDLPTRATIRTLSMHERLESPNVAGLLPGSDPRLRDEVLVFSAHLDHLGIGEPVRGDSIYNGALDNASGSAALLEIARAFSSLPHPPRRSVLFLAVTAEEMGLLGSDYFAQHPTVPIEKIVADINIDGLSILYPLRQMVPLGAEHSTLDATVRSVAQKTGIELGPDPFPQEVFFIRSDQYSFVRRGVPSLFLFMGLRSDSGVDASARFREWLATRYHTPQDDLSQPMDLQAGSRHAQVAFLVGLEVANADEKPVWKPGDFFGTMFSRNEPRR
jgi:Peptidase family M28/PA domain